MESSAVLISRPVLTYSGGLHMCLVAVIRLMEETTYLRSPPALLLLLLLLLMLLLMLPLMLANHQPATGRDGYETLFCPYLAIY